MLFSPILAKMLRRAVNMVAGSTHASAMRARCVSRAFHADSVKILYGSQTGTGMGFAMQLGEAAPEKGLAAEIVDLYEYDGKSLPGEKAPVVFIVSCFGRGEPTDSSKKFFKWLETADKDSLKDLKYTVFGLGSSGTHKEYYNVVSKRLDKRLEELGAKRIFPRGEGDDNACIELDFEAWQKAFLDAVEREGGDATASTPVTTDAPAAAASTTTAPAQQKAAAKTPVFQGSWNPIHSEEASLTVVPAQVPCDGKVDVCHSPLDVAYSPAAGTKALEVTSLTNLTPGEERPIFELRLSNKKGFPYVTGDHVAVLPENDATSVAKLCDLMRWDPEFLFSVQPSGRPGQTATKPPFSGTCSVQDVLSSVVDLQANVSPNMLRVLASCATDATEKATLLALTEKDKFLSAVKNEYVTVAQLLTRFKSIRMPLDRFISTCPTIVPRYYSVSSSSSMYTRNGSSTPSELHVTFRHMRVPTTNGLFGGLCTSFMASRRMGDKVRLSIRPSEFRLPLNPAERIIMLGGGIGLAPFKAFLEERIHQKRTSDVAFGPSLLLYGCRDEDDAVYENLMRDAVQCGALTAYDIGYGLPKSASNPKRMADTLVLDHAEEVWGTLQSDGAVYVCGGAKGFGLAVAQSVRNIAKQKGGMSEDKSIEYLSGLLAACKYVEDLAD